MMTKAFRDRAGARGPHRRRLAAGRLLLGAGLALALAALVAACGSSGGSNQLSLVAYSTPETVYTDSLIPGFQKTSQGDGVDFSTSFGPSGDQSRAVEGGQPADVVHFSLQPDMQRVVDSGSVDANWDQNQYDGIVEDSVVTFVVRKGNPLNIQTWDDLVKPGVDVVTPNPFESGGAKWNLMAAYGAQINAGKTPEEALTFLKALLQNAPVQPASARDATTAFTGGKGDVLIAYENEAIAAQKAGEDVDYVTPDDTILIQTPIAVTKDAPPSAQDFVDYLYTPQAQQLWADAGYRPVVKSVFAKNTDQFPVPPGLFTIDDLGGWDKLNTDFFDPEKGKVAAIENDLGVSTG
jgi:sulfate/thiosulfate-binding protein